MRKSKKKWTIKLASICGECDWESRTITLDANQHDFEFLDTAIHELTHALHPNWSESKVSEISNTYARALWDLGYRRKFKNISCLRVAI